ncbi:MAG: IS5/IS1182 family transposase [Lachnospiraceae bacterium]|jgi:transposase|nr:IS5/IS1182 family transposase [Lachnospiraceae bacterium]
MITEHTEQVRNQIQFFSIDDLVPQDHLLRIIDKAIDWSFIYDLVRDKYSPDNGRPSIDPVTLIKIPLIQYLYGIKSMRQTIKDIEVNVAYRWFLGLELGEKVPHFTTFGKNYTRRFQGTDLFEQIFQHILEECYRFKLVDPTEVFVDATHVKARANNKKMRRRIAKEEALFYAEMLRKDINADRETHGKKPLKDKDDGVKPVFPYKRPMTKAVFFKKYEYVYDEYNDCYICPNDQILKYSTTNRDGYKEYKSCGHICEKCDFLSQCTASKNHVKVVTRHVWEEYMEACEDIRHTRGMKDLYSHRKETIERIFGTAKENHGFRYTQMYGKARMKMKVALTYSAMNLKKLAKIKNEWGLQPA